MNMKPDREAKHDIICQTRLVSETRPDMCRWQLKVDQ